MKHVFYRTLGFTLLEVIVTLTVGALFMAVVLPYLKTPVTRSSESLNNLKNTLSVCRTMENITADYRSKKAEGSLDLVALQSAIGEKGLAQANDYGEYHVVRNRFILFDGAGQETAAGGAQHILKVTIRPVDPGANFTSLFTDELP